MNTRRVFVDMDHVLCDFNKSYIEKRYLYPDLKFPQSLPGFFANLEPIEDSVDSYKWLSENFDTWILTRASYMNAYCYTDKRLWVEKHLGLDVCKKLMIVPDKTLVIGDYLIDDCLWPGFIGKQLLFGQEEYPNWKSIINYFKITYP